MAAVRLPNYFCIVVRIRRSEECRVAPSCIRKVTYKPLSLQLPRPHAQLPRLLGTLIPRRLLQHCSRTSRIKAHVSSVLRMPREGYKSRKTAHSHPAVPPVMGTRESQANGCIRCLRFSLLGALGLEAMWAHCPSVLSLHSPIFAVCFRLKI